MKKKVRKEKQLTPEQQDRCFAMGIAITVGNHAASLGDDREPLLIQEVLLEIAVLYGRIYNKELQQ